MILDTLENAPGYATLHPRFGQAIDFMTRHDLAELPPGRHPIDGDDIWANITETPLKSEEETKIEAHDRYIDIQICLRGRETYGWRVRETCTEPAGVYNAENDIIFWEDRATAFTALNEGEFVVFFPQDAHQPLIGEGTVRKCVIKIRA